jgi:hypothetical protein
MRQTSLDAYHEITENGLLSKRRLQVYRWLFKNGPATGKEVTVALCPPDQNTGGYTTRLSELKEQGVVAEAGHKSCQFSGQTVTLWDVTDRLPNPLPPRIPTKQRLIQASKLLADMQRHISSLPATSNFVSEWNSKATEFQRSL